MRRFRVVIFACFSLLAAGASQEPKGMAWVEGGTFQMGSAMAENEKPVHTVTVSGFHIGAYELTFGEFRAFVKATGYKTTADLRGKAWIWNGSAWEEKDGMNWTSPGFSQGEDEPVVCVSWYDAVAYCNWRSAMEGRKPAYSMAGSTDSVNWRSGWNTGTHNDIVCDYSNGYRLPTEAEWEYAARGGKRGSSDGRTYAGSDNLGDAGWFSANSGNRTHSVGKKQPNQIGTYDMSGNVWEWCGDWYGSYGSGAQTDPQGAASGSGRVNRGGGWYNNASYARVAFRDLSNPWDAYSNMGFRLALSPSR